MNPWVQVGPAAPFVVPSEAETSGRFNQRVAERYRLHLEVSPEPFLGSPTAPVVLLNLNPGFDGTEPTTFADRRFVDAHLANLCHKPFDWPFVWLNPALSRSAGFRWWRQKLAPLISVVGQERTAQGVLCVEWFGYHSTVFGPTPPPLASQTYGFELVSRAMTRGATVVTMRSQRRWAASVPELDGYSEGYALTVPRM